MKDLKIYTTDVLIIGSGLSGLSLALRISDYCNVVILSKKYLREGSSLYAQGGIAAVLSQKKDEIESHIKDTLKVGCGICDYNTTKFIVSNANHCIQWLIEQGIQFDLKKDRKDYHLIQEGGHTYRRIFHISDCTGKHIENILAKKVLNISNIRIFEQCVAIDLLMNKRNSIQNSLCVTGVTFWNKRKNKVEICQARIIVLATGGASQVYKNTTNPEVSSGDGIAMAWRAGCKIANLEFHQFHPTSLYHPLAKNFLLTEALRGEGAILLRPDGSRFMHHIDHRAELAPRDIVSRAIFQEMKKLNTNFVYLDITHRSSRFIQKNFSSIYRKLLSLNLDLTQQPIPVIPAAHYSCGGIVVDSSGCTNIKRLYAIGEVSYTGFHGANRLASNSLLECLVYSWSASKKILKDLKKKKFLSLFSPIKEYFSISQKEESYFQNKKYELTNIMWDNAGIIRTTKKLQYAFQYIENMYEKLKSFHSDRFLISEISLEFRNLIEVSRLMVYSALLRKESRGSHYTLDYPFCLLNNKPTVLICLDSNIKKFDL